MRPRAIVGVLLTVAGALSLLGCGDDDQGGSQALPSEPSDILRASLGQLGEEDSYRVAFLSTPEGDELNVTEGEVEVDGTAFRSVVTYVTGETQQICETPTPAGQSFSSCREVLEEVEEEYTFEAVLTEKGQYSRTCEDGDCPDWSFTPEDDPLLLFVQAQLPSSNLDSIYSELVDITLIDADDDGLIHLRAGFNPARQELERTRELHERLGEESFGEECSGGTDQTTTCREFTFEDLQKENEDNIQQYDENPAPVDFWISPDDLLLRRAVMEIPEEPLDEAGGRGFDSGLESQKVIVELTYSDYGEVEVEIPELDLD